MRSRSLFYVILGLLTFAGLNTLFADPGGFSTSNGQNAPTSPATPPPNPAPAPTTTSLIPESGSPSTSGVRSVINDPILRQKRDIFAGYMGSALMMPITLYSFMTPPEGVHALKGISLCIKRFSFSDFPTQLNPEMSMVYGLGLLDNVIALEGSANGGSESGFSLDILSLNAAAVKPLEDYSLYGALGGRVALSNQPLLHPTYDYGGSEFVYVSAFNDSDAGQRSYSQGPLVSYSADVYAKAGIRVFQSWYLSGALGVRYVPSVSGKWYLKSDLDSWEAGDMPWEPDEWIIDGFPKTNQLLSGSTLYLNFTISPYF